jgi:ribosomal protein S18 acetylase RimI-like enzyme
MTIALHPESPSDEPFLRRLVMATAALHLGADRWPEAMRDRLLELQYSARRESIRIRFPQAGSSVILVDGGEAGWLVTARLESEMRLIEIMLAAEYRGRGAGSAVVRQVIEGAGGLPVRLSVDAMNAGAARFYQRLGFHRIGGDAVQHEMEYPGAVNA